MHAQSGRGNKRRCAAGASPKIADGRMLQFGLQFCPSGRVLHALGQQFNVEAMLSGVQVNLLFLRGEQVK